MPADAVWRRLRNKRWDDAGAAGCTSMLIVSGNLDADRPVTIWLASVSGKLSYYGEYRVPFFEHFEIRFHAGKSPRRRLLSLRPYWLGLSDLSRMLPCVLCWRNLGVTPPVTCQHRT